MADDLVEGKDQLLELFAILGAMGVQRLLRCGTTDTVLQVAEEHHDMEMLLMKDLAEPAE